MRRGIWLGTVAVALLVGGSLQGQTVEVRIMDKEKQADFVLGKQIVTTLMFDSRWSKPIFWPVRTPAGVAATRTWPIEKDIKGESVDHIHQQSFWFCYGDIVAEGLVVKDKIKGIAGVDFWSLAKGHGVIEATKVTKGSKPGTLTMHNSWNTASGERIMSEERDIEIKPLENGYLMVFNIRLKATDYPLIFEDTKEGAMAVRVRDVIRADKMGNGQIRNADGKTGEKECWGQLSRWVDYAGEADGKKIGVAILAHPENPHATCWHVRGYGLFAANPFGRSKSFPGMKGKTELARLAKGGEMTLRYGVMIYDGTRTAEQIEATYGAYTGKK